MLEWVKGTSDLVVVGWAKNDSERENCASISGMVIEWLVRVKKPSVSTAVMSSWVISSTRFSKSWSDIFGMVLEAYFVDAILVIPNNE